MSIWLQNDENKTRMINKSKLTNLLEPKAAKGSLLGVGKLLALALVVPDTKPDEELKLEKGSNAAYKTKQK